MATRLLTVPEVCKALGCGKTHVYDLIAAGELHVVDIAGPGSKQTKSRIREDDLQAYIDARTRTARHLRVVRATP